MRTSKQKLYDKAYHTLEFKIRCLFYNARARKSLRGVRFGPEFHTFYREQILPYWKQFGRRPKKLWFKYYYRSTGELDPRYIPDDYHSLYVVPHFDDPYFERQLEDKNLYSLLFPDVKRPETVFKYFAATSFSTEAVGYCNEDFTPIPREEAMARLMAGGRFILKPALDTGEGVGVRAFSSEDGAAAIAALLDESDGMDYIVQRFVTQHESLAAFNRSSLNTVRLMTLVWHGEARILAGIIRIGNPGSTVDNIGAGGTQVGIDIDTGTLKKYGFSYAKGYGVETTADGLSFGGLSLPAWDKLCRTVKDCALRLPHLKLIGWDLAVDENGDAVLIELNCHFSPTQSSNGPTFGELTDEVLAEIFRKK